LNCHAKTEVSRPGTGPVADAQRREGFGSCTNIGECEAVCPKEIKISVIARMNRDYIAASWKRR
jgi:succinate dehydrogenase/fumarate reductase-like Fe-S protein